MLSHCSTYSLNRKYSISEDQIKYAMFSIMNELLYVFAI